MVVFDFIRIKLYVNQTSLNAMVCLVNLVFMHLKSNVSDYKWRGGYDKLNFKDNFVNTFHYYK